MIIIATLLAGLAAFGLVGAPAGRQVHRRLQSSGPLTVPRPGRGSREPKSMLTFLVLVAIPVVAGSSAGVRGLCLGSVAAIITGTVIMLASRSARRQRAARQQRLVAQACTVLAAQLRIGQVPLTAVRSAAEDCPVLRPAVATADLGGDVAATWLSQARAPGQSGLAELARGWQLCERTGASMAETLEDVAEALVADESLALVINSEAAGPRASGKIMAGLPLLGIGLGYLIGGEPIQFLLGSRYGWACLLAGTVLACGGVLWMERVADRAASTA